MAFDPCREWLGIDAIDLGDPWRVLGLAPGCSDPAAISAAAARRLQALRQVNPGPFAKAHAALVARVEEARETLLAMAFSAAASAPDLEQGSSVAPSPVPPTAPHPTWGHAVDAPSVASPSSPTAEDGFQPALAPVVKRAAGHRRAPSSDSGSILVTLVAFMTAAVAVLVFLMLRPNPFVDQAPVEKLADVTPPRTDIPIGSNAGHDPQRRPLKPLPSKPLLVESPATAPAPERMTVREDQEGAGDREMGQRGQEPQDPASSVAPKAKMAEQQAIAERNGEETFRGQEPAMNAREPSEDQERARLQESLETAISEAYAALQRGEFDTADRAIAAAVNQVGDDVAAATRLERWRLFVTYAREFIGYRDQAFAAAQAGRDYTADGKTFALIEITPEMFIYRLAGRNERVARERLDPRIELAVVEKWFAADGRPANHLFLGSRWLSLAPPNIDRARAEWRIAGDGGEEVAPLLALIDDPVIRRAARGATR